MNGLSEIRLLFATHYFNDSELVGRASIVARVIEVPPHPGGKGGIWPPTYHFLVKCQIGADDLDWGQIIDSVQFEAMRDGAKAEMVETIWREYREQVIARLETRQKECDAVLQR